MKIKFKKKGFTLIELLIVVAIISILVSVILVSVISGKRKAKDASFKSTVSSLNKAMIMCCSKRNGLIQTDVNGSVCAPPDAGVNYPGSDSIGSIDVSAGSNHNCSNGSFRVTVTPGSKNKGNCNSAVITINGPDYSNSGC